MSAPVPAAAGDSAPGPVGAIVPPDALPPRGTLLAYLPWHARDAAVRALTPLVISALLLSIPLGAMANGASWAVLREPGRLQDAALGAYRQTIELAITLGALLVASGFVAADRDRGHVRFLFSAPIVPWRFYLQRFVVGAVCFVLAVSCIPLAFGLVVRTVPVAPAATSAALYALLIGSLALLAGAITRRDGAVVIGVLLLAGLLQPLAAQAELPAALEAFAASLPPLHAADRVRADLLQGSTPDGRALVHVLGYASGMLAAALVVLRRAPLVR